jgi:hypothetical protein
VSDLTLGFTVRPSTVAAAVYGVMTVVSERTSSMARLDDLRVALDELFYALPHDNPVWVDLAVDVGPERSQVTFTADVADVQVHDTIAALVDQLEIRANGVSTTARIAVRHG